MESQPEFPKCYLHKTQPLNWVCLDGSCEKRLLCSHCVIFSHKDIHKSFNEINHIIKDPLSQLLSSNHLQNSKISESLLDVVSRFAQQEEDKLTDIYNGIITEISKHFNEIRKNFHEDLARFIKEHEQDLEKIDSQRKDYLTFCSNYFTRAVYESKESLKEGLDLIVSKFTSDNSLQKLFDESIKALPQVNYTKITEISLGGRKLQDIKWNFFTDKGLSKFFEIKDFITVSRVWWRSLGDVGFRPC